MTIIEKIERNSCGCDGLPHRKDLISIDEAFARIARETRAVAETENVDLAQASGRVLGRSLRALGAVPPFDNAAMDGYAINTGDLTGDGPWELDVKGRVAAGHADLAVMPPGAAVQIFTGAPVPRGANAVVMQEDVVRHENRIRLMRAVRPGSQMRKAGEDMRAGKMVLPAGRLLGPREVAVCAAAGHAVVPVIRRIRVALLVTGDEVVQPGQTRGAAGIWDLNTPMLRAALLDAGVELAAVEVAADTRNALRAQIETLARGVDLLVTTGGISAGEEDHVKPALSDLEAKIIFSGVALKPGKPVSFGRVGRAHWLGLPGNPLSAYVTWQLFGVALCQALSGRARASGRRHVTLQRALHHTPGRCELRLACVSGFDGTGREIVDFVPVTQSGRVAPLAEMDGLLFVPAEAETLDPGALVEFHPF